MGRFAEHDPSPLPRFLEVRILKELQAHFS
jgi:hypothetical protein